jgi:hypothetical protein
MIESPSAGLGPRRLSRQLMVGGLGLWGVSVSGALAPRVLRAALYPNHSEAPHFDLVAAQPLGAPVLWTALVVWCVSWAFVVGYLASAWAARHGRPSWASPALLLLSLASPFVFGFAVSVLPRLATHGAYHGDGVIPFLSAAVLQLVISQTYSFASGFRHRAELQPAEGP